MTALILFTRELVVELRRAADQWDAELVDTSVIDGVRALRIIAGAVEAAAKRAFHL